MKNAKTADKKKDFNGKIAGLTVLEALFYILSLPLIVILSLVFCIKTYELVPYYSFWPFVGVLLAGVLCLVFVIVVMCVSMRKKSKRTILMQTGEACKDGNYAVQPDYVRADLAAAVETILSDDK